MESHANLGGAAAGGYEEEVRSIMLNRSELLVLITCSVGVACGSVKAMNVDCAKDPSAAECRPDASAIDAAADAPPGSPSINSIDFSRPDISPGGTAEITCNATDPEGDDLTFTWDVSAGQLVGQGSQIAWTAPTMERSVTVKCTAEDVDGNRSSKTEMVRVLIWDGLVAAYMFEGDGADLTQANDASIPSGMTFVMDRHGQPSGALHFDGVDDVISIPNEPKFDLDTITITAAVRVEAANANRGILAKGTVKGGHYSLHIIADDAMFSPKQLQWSQAWMASGGVNVFSEVPVPQSVYVHVAAVRNGATLKLYLNGSPVSELNNVGVSETKPNDDPVRIGRNGNEIAGMFKGDVDEIRIYDRALTDADIATISTSSP